MKIFGREVTLSREKPPKVIGREQGSSLEAGAPYASYLEDDFFNGRRKPRIKEIMNMIDTDGTAAMLYSVVTFPLLAATWRIDADPKDVAIDSNGNETHPQADFVEAALRNPEHKGGMSTPFSLVMSEMVLAIAQGYKFFEIVYKLNDDGKIVFKKIVSRDYRQIEILTDETGGFDGVKQTVSRDGKEVTVTIDLPYCFLFTHRKDRNKLKGMSAFTSAWYHYDKKHRFYYLSYQQANASAINPKSLEEPDGVTPEVRDANLQAAHRMATRPVISLPFGWKLNVHSPGQVMDMIPHLNHHDAQMARSFLAQMLLLGNQQGNSGGSYSLSENHSDLFILGIQSIMNSIEEHINAFLIAKLHNYNFDNPLYSSFKFNDLTNANKLLLREAFKALVSKGTLPQWITDGISEKVAEQLDIPMPDEGVEEEPDDDGNTPSSGATVEQSRQSKVTKLAKPTWWRELTAPEAKVNFSSIQKKADSAEDKLLNEMRPVFDKIRKDATDRLKPLIEEQGARALDGFELKYPDELRRVMSDNMISMYSTAKNMAADELKVAAPANKQKSKDLMIEHTKAIVEKQYGDLLFNVKTIVTDAVRKNLLDKTELSVGEVIAAISAAFFAFFEEKEPLTAGAIISAAINIGRDDVFMDNAKDVYAFQYSGILDTRICNICKDLDGSVVEEATYYSTKWMPPIHFNCRCIWVAIMEDEEDKPAITGLPESPGGATQPSLSASNRGLTWHTKTATK